MGDVEDQGEVITGSLHDTETEHVHDQVVVTKVGASLAEQQLVVPTLSEFVDDVAHLLRAQELWFFNVDHSTCVSHRPNQIGLTGQEGGQLNDVGHLGGDGSFFRAMDIRDHGNAVGVFHGLKDLKSLLEAGAAEGVNRRAVGFVVRGFEHEGNVQPLADILEML